MRGVDAMGEGVTAVGARGFRFPRRTVNRTVVVVTAIVAGVLVAAATGVAAEDALAVREAAGSGMHAFHAGEFNRAYDDLSRAIEAGSSDARVLYFRGLAALRLGRTDEAEADFIAGADREIESGASRRVSLSLERVQGHDRLALERVRSRARLAGLARDREAYSRRYSAIDDASDEVRRRRRPEEIPSELVAPGIAPAGRPAADVEEIPAPTRRTPPRKPAVDGDEPLFGEEMEEKADPGDARPAAEEADEEMAEDEKPAVDAADGDGADEEMAEDEKPAADAADGDGADEEMADEKPAADAADGDAADEDMADEEMAEDEKPADAADGDTTSDDAAN